MSAIVNRLFLFAIVLGGIVLGLPFNASGQSETPTETPSATPTPSATARPAATPDIVQGLLPNFKFVKTGAALAYDPRIDNGMTVNPSTGDLYFLGYQSSSDTYILQIFDANGFQLKDSIVLNLKKFNNSGVGNVCGMIIDRKGDLYIGTKPGSAQECWILRMPAGGRSFEIFHKIQNVKYTPYVSLLPIEEGSVPPGVPGPGMLFFINYVPEEKDLSAGIYYLNTAEPDRPANRIALLPIKTNRDKYLDLVIGPENRLFVMDIQYIYRLEADGSMTEWIGRNSHFRPIGYLEDIAYDSINRCFYFTEFGTLYRATPDFQQVLTVSDRINPFRCWKVEYSPKTNQVLVARENSVYRLESAEPYPTPTKTPTPNPPISTFRPTVFPTDPAGNPMPLVPYVNLRLVSQVHPEIRSLAVDPDTNDLYYHYYEYLPYSWTGGLGQNKLFSTVRGPIRTHDGFTPLIQQPLFGRYEGSLPFEKRMVVAKGDRIYMPDYKTVRLQRGNRKEEFNISSNEMLYVGPDCHFMDVPPGSILFYKWFSRDSHPPYVMGYFDPSEEVPTGRNLTLPPQTIERLKDLYGGNSFFWGPEGKLHFEEYYSLYRFETDGSITLVRDRSGFGSVQLVSGFSYLSKDNAFYFTGTIPNYPNVTLLFRSPENSNGSQPILSFSSSIPLLRTVSADGSKLYLAIKSDKKIWEFEPHFTPGVPVATPTPTPFPGTPTPTPSPMDWMMLDGFGGIHVSRPEVQKPVLPYFLGFDIARDLEPDPLGRGWYMLDGYGGIHLSSPDLPRPDNLPYFWQDDIARDLEIIEKDGQLTFVIMDGYGRLYVVGPHADEVNCDAPLFGSNMARDLEPAPTGDGWLVMDAYGALFDSRDHSVSVAAGTYWLDAWFARDLTVFPDEATLMIDSYGGRHYREGKSPLNRLYPIPSELYFWGWEIVWDFEVVK